MFNYDRLICSKTKLQFVIAFNYLTALSFWIQSTYYSGELPEKTKSSLNPTDRKDRIHLIARGQKLAEIIKYSKQIQPFTICLARF